MSHLRLHVRSRPRSRSRSHFPLSSSIAFAILVMMSILSIPSDAAKLRIGTKVSAPLSFKDAANTANHGWDGFDWDMINLFIKEGLKINNETVTEFNVTEKSSNSEGFKGLLNNEYDVWMASSTKTSSREAIVDFTHTFFKAGLRILVHNIVDAETVTIRWLKNIFTNRTIFVILIGFLSILTLAAIVWTIEMLLVKTPDKYFSTFSLKGLLQATVWAFNLMVVDSYEKSPRHPISKGVGSVLRHSKILIAALLTSLITAATLTAPEVTAIAGPSDLVGKTVAVVPYTTAATWVASGQAGGTINTKTYSSYDAAIAGFQKYEVNAFVYDDPRLIYYVKQQEAKNDTSAKVVGEQFQPQDYGLALAPNNQDLKEQFNSRVLAFWESAYYLQYYAKWFNTKTHTAAQTDLVWTIDHISILSAVFVAILLFVIIVQWRGKLKAQLKEEMARDAEMEDRRRTIAQCSNAELAGQLSRVIDNQAKSLRMLYMMTFRDEYYTDQPVSREEVEMMVKRIREADYQFVRRHSISQGQGGDEDGTGNGKDKDKDKKKTGGNGEAKMTTVLVDPPKVISIPVPEADSR